MSEYLDALTTMWSHVDMFLLGVSIGINLLVLVGFLAYVGELISGERIDLAVFLLLGLFGPVALMLWSIPMLLMAS